ncbi:MAG: SUF system NifU family Fe-S cluster assembly protein [candidate division Zixibacteria bacterium]|nr:SUF system NifU family Fe-S cluster assembly protein [candidate division Zixibacteria bacterium]
MNERLDDLYRDIILDHYRSPRGRNPVERADIATDGHNPSCGDEVELKVEIDEDRVKNIHVDCRGCAISVASGSMLAEVIKGKSINEIKEISRVVRAMLKGDTDDIPEDLGDLDALKGVRQFPVRIKCALLAWLALIEGVKNFEEGHGADGSSISTEE